jgi:hypothetical protein
MYKGVSLDLAKKLCIHMGCRTTMKNLGAEEADRVAGR